MNKQPQQREPETNEDSPHQKMTHNNLQTAKVALQLDYVWKQDTTAAAQLPQYYLCAKLLNMATITTKYDTAIRHLSGVTRTKNGAPPDGEADTQSPQA